jgi:hypothetical protein
MPLDDQKERNKALDIAVGQIEKQFGKGSIMRLGQRGAIALDRTNRGLPSPHTSATASATGLCPSSSRVREKSTSSSIGSITPVSRRVPQTCP